MSKEISYSDGDIENEILLALKEAPDVSSNAEICREKQSQSWPFEYHLSRARANIIRHIDFSGKRVLEVGAGMGGVSRYVAENCEFLQVVEGTSRRLGCLNERLRGLTNFDVYCGNFQHFQSEQKFDIVLIIGVLEYSEMYFEVESGKNPFVEFLRKAKSLLNSGGSVVVAIENRLGIKYWAGATEDHTGGFYDGILGYKSGKSVRTFSKKELTDLFRSAGFGSISAQYPFPDYKLPKSILTEELEMLNPKLFASIAGATIGRDYALNRPILFSDSMAIEGLSGTGLLGEFSNSFLFIAKEDAMASVAGEDFIGCSYGIGRSDICVTKFKRLGDSIRVSKELLRSDAKEADYGPVRWVCPSTTLVSEGRLLITLFRKYISFREWDLFDEELSRFLRWMLQVYGSGDGLLRPEAWDMIPQNIILNEDSEYLVIDREWILIGRDFSVSWFVLRCLLSFDFNLHEVLRRRFGSLLAFHKYCCSIVGADSKRVEMDCALEVEAQLYISGQYSNEKLEERKTQLFEYIKSSEKSFYADTRCELMVMLSDGQNFRAQNETIKGYELQLREIEQNCISLREEIAAYKGTFFYRMSKLWQFSIGGKILRKLFGRF